MILKAIKNLTPIKVVKRSKTGKIYQQTVYRRSGTKEPENVKMKLDMDAMGNKIIKIKTPHGGFSIQTLGNIPTAHKEYGKIESKEAVLGEVKKYIKTYGTKRQKKILGV